MEAQSTGLRRSSELTRSFVVGSGSGRNNASIRWNSGNYAYKAAADRCSPHILHTRAISACDVSPIFEDSLAAGLWTWWWGRSSTLPVTSPIDCASHSHEIISG